MPSLSPQQFRVASAASTALVHRTQYMTGALAAPQAHGALLVALLVNAWHESALGEWATVGGKHAGRGGDNGQSWGPWQTHLKGAGAGHNIADLMDPLYGATLILIETHRQDQRTGLLSRALTGGSVAQFCAVWTAEVERPANRHQKGVERAATIDEWWGPGTGALPAWDLWGAPPSLT